VIDRLLDSLMVFVFWDLRNVIGSSLPTFGITYRSHLQRSNFFNIPIAYL